MGYRDELEAAHRKVEALERQLRALVPDDALGAAELDAFELRRRLAAAELALVEERRLREAAEARARALEAARERLQVVEKALELVQEELQRRRREHEPLWREAALAEVHRRELEALRERFAEASRSAAREAKRADVAEVALMRAQMRLSVERARAQVRRAWPRDPDPRALARNYRPGALLRMPEEALRLELERLALLFAERLWGGEGPPGEAVGALLEVLREAGHPLLAQASRRFGPDPPEGAGLTVAFAPLGLQITWSPAGEDRRVVTVTDADPLAYAVHLR